MRVFSHDVSKIQMILRNWKKQSTCRIIVYDTHYITTLSLSDFFFYMQRDVVTSKKSDFKYIDTMLKDLKNKIYNCRPDKDVVESKIIDIDD